MPYASLIADARRFYAGLTADNTKDWWQANKTTYDTRLKAPALALIDAMTPRLSNLTGHPATGKLFRPHRDVRFSKDKTPYTTHLHMMWTLAAGGRQDPVVFFGIAPDYVTLGAGVMAFDKPVLDDWRRMVDLDRDRIGGVIADARRAGFTMWEPALKRVPSPYPADHPLADLLRCKGLILKTELGDQGEPDDMITAGVAPALPVLRMLDSIL